MDVSRVRRACHRPAGRAPGKHVDRSIFILWDMGSNAYGDDTSDPLPPSRSVRVRPMSEYGQRLARLWAEDMRPRNQLY